MAMFLDMAAGGIKTATTDCHTGTMGNSLVASTVQSIFCGCDGRNTGAQTLYYFIFNSKTVPANANAATTLRHVIQVTAGANFGSLQAWNGEQYTAGITIVASTTDAPLLTIAADNKSFISVDYATDTGLETT